MTVQPLSRIRRYLAIILRWLALASVVFVLTVLGGNYIADNFLFKVSAASATIQIPPSDLMPAAAGEKPDTAAFQPEFERIIRSPDFLLPVIMDLNLDKAWAGRVLQESQLSPQDALAHMNEILKLDATRGTNLVNITVSSDVPKEAADIANAIADRYKTMRDVGGDLQGNPVLILSRAQTPAVPNKFFAHLVILLAAGIHGVIAASFVEMVFLFLRAADRPNN